MSRARGVEFDLEIQGFVKQEVRRHLLSPVLLNSLIDESIPERKVEKRSVVSFLPKNPEDGQIVEYLADSDAGVVWTFRYRKDSTSQYRWEFVGGSSVESRIDASSTMASATYGDLADQAGPSFEIPLSGDYRVNFGAREFGGNSNGQVYFMNPYTSTPGDDLNAVQAYVYNATGAYRDDVYNSASRGVALTGLTAGSTLKVYYRATVGTLQAGWRWMNVTPTRVTGA